jgi:hypothetical protein
LEAARSRIKQLRKELIDIENQDEETAIVYQANLNLFPVTKMDGEEKS